MHQIIWRINCRPKFTVTSYRTRQKVSKMASNYPMKKKPYISYYKNRYKIFNIPCMVRGNRWQRLVKLRQTLHDISHKGY